MIPNPIIRRNYTRAGLLLVVAATITVQSNAQDRGGRSPSRPDYNPPRKEGMNRRDQRPQEASRPPQKGGDSARRPEARNDDRRGPEPRRDAGRPGDDRNRFAPQQAPQRRDEGRGRPPEARNDNRRGPEPRVITPNDWVGYHFYHFS